MSKLKFVAYPAIVLLSLAAALSAHAAGGTTGDITTDNTAGQSWAQTKSRAQVQQELFAARAEGSIQIGELGINQFAAAPRSARTRDQVQASVRSARGADAARMTGEDSGSFYLSQHVGKHDGERVLAGTQR